MRSGQPGLLEPPLAGRHEETLAGARDEMERKLEGELAKVK